MSVFKFKYFDVIQSNSSMKVGTDGVLLGSWVSCERLDNILDIGCGTGLIALMLAQRNTTSSIIGIEIDKLSSEEARLNAERSSWSNRIEILNTSLQDYRSHTKFDLIVSNPPFFDSNNSLKRRDIARRVNALSYKELIVHSRGLLANHGTLSVILPIASKLDFVQQALDYKLYCNRLCYVKGTPNTAIKRVLMEFSLIQKLCQEDFLIIEKSRHQYTEQYISLCKDFYLNM